MSPEAYAPRPSNAPYVVEPKADAWIATHPLGFEIEVCEEKRMAGDCSSCRSRQRHKPLLAPEPRAGSSKRRPYVLFRRSRRDSTISISTLSASIGEGSRPLSYRFVLEYSGGNFVCDTYVWLSREKVPRLL